MFLLGVYSFQLSAQTKDKEVALQQIALLQSHLQESEHKVQELEAAKEQLEQNVFSIQSSHQQLEELHSKVRKYIVLDRSASVIGTFVMPWCTYTQQAYSNLPVSVCVRVCAGYKINGRPVTIGDVKQRYGDILCHIGFHRGNKVANLAVVRMLMHKQLSAWACT